MINKIWCGKATGIISALLIILLILYERILSKLTTWLYLLNSEKSGKNISIMSGFFYRYPRFIHIMDNVIIGKDTSFTSEESSNHFLLIENGVSIGEKCILDFTGGVTIKRDTHIAHNVSISTHDHGYDYRNKPICKSLIIGECVFIGSNSIIMHNCNYIGHHAVIGTGSIVTKDIPDFAVVAGNPAKIIKFIAQ